MAPGALSLPHAIPCRRPARYADNATVAITNTCRSSELAIGAPNGSRSSWNVSLAAMLLLRLLRGPGAFGGPVLNGLRHNTDVGNAGLLHCIHDRCESAKWNALIRLEVDHLVRGIDTRFRQSRRQVGEIHRLITEKNLLIAIDGHHHALFRQFLNRPGLGNRNLDARLKNRRR